LVACRVLASESEEGTMTLTSVFDWETCDHQGIGQPGCFTCDPEPRRVIARLQERLAAEKAAHEEERKAWERTDQQWADRLREENNSWKTREVALLREVSVWKAEHAKAHGDWLETRKKVDAALKERDDLRAQRDALEIDAQAINESALKQVAKVATLEKELEAERERFRLERQCALDRADALSALEAKVKVLREALEEVKDSAGILTAVELRGLAKIALGCPFAATEEAP
jgi:hypothetical protein